MQDNSKAMFWKFTTCNAKVQLISECSLDLLNFPKKPMKYLTDFCLGIKRSCKSGQINKIMAKPYNTIVYK
jgi:hypothetical protein